MTVRVLKRRVARANAPCARSVATSYNDSELDLNSRGAHVRFVNSVFCACAHKAPPTTVDRMPRSLLIVSRMHANLNRNCAMITLTLRQP